MIKKECANIREKFSDYIDEFLPETEMADLEMHMKNCPFCEKELEAYNKTVQALRNLPKYSIHPKIIVKINERIDQDKSWWQRLNNKGFKGALGAITAVILCVFGLQIYNNNTNKINVNVVTVGDSAKTPTSVVNKARESSELKKNKSQSKVVGAKEAGKADNKMAVRKAQAPVGEDRGSATDKLAIISPAKDFIKAEEQLQVAAKPLNEKNYDKSAQESNSGATDFGQAPSAAKQSNVLVIREQAGQSSFEQKGLYCNSTPVVSSGSSFEAITITVVNDKNNLKNFWKKHFAELPEPVINFKNDMLLAIFLNEQGSEPKDIVLKDIITEKNRLKVVYTTVLILNTDTSGKKLSPYCLKTVKKTDLPVVLVKE